MSLKGTRLRIMELYRRKAEVFRSQEEEPFLRKRLSRYCIIVETFRAVVEGVEAAAQSRRVCRSWQYITASPNI